MPTVHIRLENGITGGRVCGSVLAAAVRITAPLVLAGAAALLVVLVTLVTLIGLRAARARRRAEAEEAEEEIKRMAVPPVAGFTWLHRLDVPDEGDGPVTMKAVEHARRAAREQLEKYLLEPGSPAVVSIVGTPEAASDEAGDEPDRADPPAAPGPAAAVDPVPIPTVGRPALAAALQPRVPARPDALAGEPEPEDDDPAAEAAADAGARPDAPAGTGPAAEADAPPAVAGASVEPLEDDLDRAAPDGGRLHGLDGLEEDPELAALEWELEQLWLVVDRLPDPPAVLRRPVDAEERPRLRALDDLPGEEYVAVVAEGDLRDGDPDGFDEATGGRAVPWSNGGASR
ncbi:MAG TPA: hypothetical protein VKG45_06445 [Actinomycetes bacterium]|nr:hypothetical protein [Actinomycetes bacterium]